MSDRRAAQGWGWTDRPPGFDVDEFRRAERFATAVIVSVALSVPWCIGIYVIVRWLVTR